MAKVIGLTIAITFALAGPALAGSVDPEGVGTGTVATATPTGIMGGTVATATPTEVPTATVVPTNTPTPTFFNLIDEGGCAVGPLHGIPAAWWMLALPGLAIGLRKRAHRRRVALQKPRPRRRTDE